MYGAGFRGSASRSAGDLRSSARLIEQNAGACRSKTRPLSVKPKNPHRDARGDGCAVTEASWLAVRLSHTKGQLHHHRFRRPAADAKARRLARPPITTLGRTRCRLSGFPARAAIARRGFALPAPHPIPPNSGDHAAWVRTTPNQMFGAVARHMVGLAQMPVVAPHQ